MYDDKIVESNEEMMVHRLIATMPEFNRKYGLWIVNANRDFTTLPDNFYTCRVRRFEFYSLSHLKRGAGHLWIEGQPEKDLYPGDLVVMTPGVLNRYGGYHGQPYVEDSIQFCGPIADMMAAAPLSISVHSRF